MGEGTVAPSGQSHNVAMGNQQMSYLVIYITITLKVVDVNRGA